MTSLCSRDPFYSANAFPSNFFYRISFYWSKIYPPQASVQTLLPILRNWLEIWRFHHAFSIRFVNICISVVGWKQFSERPWLPVLLKRSVCVRCKQYRKTDLPSPNSPLSPGYPCSPTGRVTSKAGGHVTFRVRGRALHRRLLPSRRRLSDRRVNRCSRCLLWQVIIVGSGAKAIKPEGLTAPFGGLLFRRRDNCSGTFSPARPRPRSIINRRRERGRLEAFDVREAAQARLGFYVRWWDGETASQHAATSLYVIVISLCELFF